MPQEVFLLHDNIFTNITLGDDDISQAQVWQALKRVGAESFVAALPNQLHEPVGERGLLLSGGQRQRIALARAIVRDPALLILDEATASLDPLTEAQVVDTVASLCGAMTVLAITHQRAFAERANRVYRVADGGVTCAA